VKQGLDLIDNKQNEIHMATFCNRHKC